MRTLSFNSVSGFRADGTIHKSVVWRADPPNPRVNRIDLTASHPLPSEPENPELPNDDFPFSALLWLVRKMR